MDAAEILTLAVTLTLGAREWLRDPTRLVPSSSAGEKQEEDKKTKSEVWGIERLTSTRLTSRVLSPMIIIFDLDYTLIRTPIESMGLRDITTRDRAAAFYDGEFFRKFCEACIVRGHQLRIATMASTSSCHKESAMDVSFLFDSVLPRDRSYLKEPAHIACWLSKKNYKLNHITEIRRCTKSSREGDFGPDRVVLLDDTVKNVKSACQEGYEGFLCPNPMTDPATRAASAQQGVASPVASPTGALVSESVVAASEYAASPNSTSSLSGSITISSSLSGIGGGHSSSVYPYTTIGFTRDWFKINEAFQFLIGIFYADLGLEQ